MQKVGGFYNPDQSGREDTINVLIDRFDKDFAFLVQEVDKNLSPEPMKTGAMKEIYNKLSPAEYKHVLDVPVPGKFNAISYRIGNEACPSVTFFSLM
jgi:hypothetical protein